MPTIRPGPVPADWRQRTAGKAGLRDKGELIIEVGE